MEVYPDLHNKFNKNIQKSTKTTFPKTMASDKPQNKATKILTIEIIKYNEAGVQILLYFIVYT